MNIHIALCPKNTEEVSGSQLFLICPCEEVMLDRNGKRKFKLELQLPSISHPAQEAVPTNPEGRFEMVMLFTWQSIMYE